MSISIVKSKNVYGAQLATLQLNEDIIPCIKTDAIRINTYHPNMASDRITFAITRDMCADLYNQIIELESSLVTYIRKISEDHFSKEPNDYFTNLPVKCKKIITEYMDCLGTEFYKVLRTNYYKSVEPTLYLKGKFKSSSSS